MELTSENYVDIAEDVVNRLEYTKKRDKNGNEQRNYKLTTSKIRNILSMISAIYNDAIHLPNEKLSQELVQRIQYLRMRFVYEAGREDAVKNLMEVAEISKLLKNIGNNKEKCILFCRYMEAIVAYHKFYGGRD